MKREYKSLSRVLLALFIGQVAFFYFLSSNDYFISNVYPLYVQALYIAISRVSARFYFSIGDILYGLLFFYIVYLLSYLLKCIYKKDFSHLKRLMYKGLIFLNIFFFVYQILWGMQYDRVSSFASYKVEDIYEHELKSMSIEMLLQCKQMREYCDEDTLGFFTTNLTDKQLYGKLLSSWEKQGESSSFKAIPWYNVKASIFSQTISYLGIAGYFNPFTIEAQYNSCLPATSHSFNVAHEVAHQMGFAPEGEASFVGFLNLYNSDNQNLKYIARLRVMKSSLNMLYEKDSVFVDSMVAAYSLPMKRDRLLEEYYSLKYDSFLETYFSGLNDLFLKSNNQEEGVESYGDFVGYVIGLKRKGLL